MGSEDLAKRFEEARAARSQKTKAAAEERKAARMEEYLERVVPVLDTDSDGSLIEHEVEEGGGDVAGWVLIERPPRANYLAWRAKRFNQSQERGAADRRDRADRELVDGLVAYPDPKPFGELVDRFPALYDVLAAKAIKAAEAYREEEGKG